VLQWRDRFRRLSQLGEADAEVVGDFSILNHAVQRLQDGQGVLKETVLQQALNVVLGVHALLWDGEYAHETVFHRHHRLPTLRGVAQGVVHDHCLFELWRAGLYAGRHDGCVELVKRDLEDFGGRRRASS